MSVSKSNPIIFIGMHRSGTSLLGKLLEQLGLFSGSKKDENNEAIFFRDINNWLLIQSGARWDNPCSIQNLWSNESVLALIEDYINFILCSPRSIQYMGYKLYAAYRSIACIDFPWGWKDPRNTFTLPFWLRMFPNAKIIYIERHGVDVAQSLLSRNQEGFRSAQKKYRKYKLLLWIRRKRGGFTESLRCTNLDGGLSLWCEYQQKGNEVISQMKSDRIMKIRYEDLLYKPVSIVREAAFFCGLSPDRKKIEEVCKRVNNSRAFAFNRDISLHDFAMRNSKLLEKFGY